MITTTGCSPGPAVVGRGAGHSARPVADAGDHYSPGPRGWLVRLKAGGPIVGARVPIARPIRLTATQARAARRLRELAELASWRGRWGVVSEARGWAIVAGDALAALDGVGRWRCDPDGIAAQMPPDQQNGDAIAAALAAPHRPGRLLSGREAGQLVELVELEASDADMGAAITTMIVRDLDDDALVVRRAERRRTGARERKRRARAKCVTPEIVTTNVTLGGHTSNRTMRRDIARVTNFASEITAVSVASALALKPSAARARLLRWQRAGLICKTGRGAYRPAGGVP